MILTYLVCKEKGGGYYVVHKDCPKEPISGSFGNKRHAMRFAAVREGITCKEYMKNRKEID